MFVLQEEYKFEHLIDQYDYALASQIGHLYAIFDLLGLCDAYFYNVYFYAINMMINFVSLVFA